jgi:hypothetical protein
MTEDDLLGKDESRSSRHRRRDTRAREEARLCQDGVALLLLANSRSEIAWLRLVEDERQPGKLRVLPDGTARFPLCRTRDPTSFITSGVPRDGTPAISRKPRTFVGRVHGARPAQNAC